MGTPSSLPPIELHFDLITAAKIEEDNAKSREAHMEALQISLGAKSGEDGGEGGLKKAGARDKTRLHTP